MKNLAILLVLLLSTGILAASNASFTSNSQQVDNTLSSHWVNGWCYRDELNSSDNDYQNCWTDNAGKILTMGMITHDYLDASKAFEFIRDNFENSSYYLPELVINSSLLPTNRSGNTFSITNRIIELQASNITSSDLEQLAIGTDYTGPVNLAYLGADRLWLNEGSGCCAARANSSLVFEIPNGFSKRSFYDLGGKMFYAYLNATLQTGKPYADISLQVESLNASTASGDYAFLQAFNSSNTFGFESGALYAANGTFARGLPSSGAFPVNSSGMTLTYSNHTSVFTSSQGGSTFGQDAVAIQFSSQNIQDIEHWSDDGPFDGRTWLGIGYKVPANQPVGQLSTPVDSRVYPILDFDHRMANETAGYIASGTSNSSVSPPVSFGFVALGLALYAQNDSSYTDLARSFWNYYYSFYNDSDYSTAYARSVDTFALAGFELFGCNSTVEDFARRFIGNVSGAAIEEYGWAAAALYQLQSCTSLNEDALLYQSFVGSFASSHWHFVELFRDSGQFGVVPQFTFQFAEAASGLMLGGVRFNDPIVLNAMNAVYQSNVSGIVLNQPFHGDLANTETLPAYMLSTWLFEEQMKNSTGWWVAGLSNANITSIDYTNSTLLIALNGQNGTISVTNGSETKSIAVEGQQTIQVTGPSATTTTTTTTVSVSTTVTTTVISTVTDTSTTMVTTTMLVSCTPLTPGTCGIFDWAVLGVGVVIALGSLIGYVSKSRKSGRGSEK